jgi:hypothetical protein
VFSAIFTLIVDKNVGKHRMEIVRGEMMPD